MKYFIAFMLLFSGAAMAEGSCFHDQQGGNCSDRNGHSRTHSDWRGRTEQHRRDDSGRDRRDRRDRGDRQERGHGRDRSGWRPRD